MNTSANVSSMIEWNTEVLRSDLISKSDHHENGTSKFGILRIEVPVLPISTQPLAMLLNLDHSGSMDDPCADGRTKMQHIKHTIRNILQVLMIKMEENPELTIYMCIHIFSHEMKNILQKYVTENKENVVLDSDTLLDGCSRISRMTTERSPEEYGCSRISRMTTERSPEEYGCSRISRMTTERSPEEYGFLRITKKSVQWIMDEVERIVPWGCTNIELSLKSAKDRMDTFRENHPEFRMAHIQLTDGQATLGKSLPEDLKPFVDTSYRNIFVGYGEDHDGHLMTSLGELSPTCEYKFVDIIENTGLVYGEILYNLLYPFHDSPVILTVTYGAKIYDWSTNQWVTDMTIPPLSGNSEKIFQIMSDGTVPTDEICVNLRTDVYTEPFDTATSLPLLLCQETGEFEPNDLTHYWLRQLTQEHLYMVREFENERASGRATVLSKPMLRRQTAHVDMDDMNQVDVPPELEIKHRHIKNALLEHFHELSVYYEAYDDTHTQQFVKVLMDDVYVAIQNMGTERGLMYTAARQTSQGRQSSYIPTGQVTCRSQITSSQQSSTMKTVELFGQDQDHNYHYMPSSAESTFTLGADNDRTSMMTQVQGYDNGYSEEYDDLNLSLSDTDTDDIQERSGQTMFGRISNNIPENDVGVCRNIIGDGDLNESSLLGESILQDGCGIHAYSEEQHRSSSEYDIGYDSRDVYNPDYYFDILNATVDKQTNK